MKTCPACAGPRRDVHTPEQLREFHPLSNPECPGCQEFRLHSPEETAKYHPLAGHGFLDNVGWCCEAAKTEGRR